MQIFIVNGKGETGKDSFEKMVIDIAKENNKIVNKISTIDYVKSIASIIGWDGTKDLKNRRFLSDLKDALTKWNDKPYKEICKQIEHLKDSSDALFIDCREPEEIERFVKDFNAMTILVKREKIKIEYGNHADDCVEDYQYDITIDNNRGLKELQKEAEMFYNTFIKEER